MDINISVALKNMYYLSGICCLITGIGHYYITLFIVPRIDKTRSESLSASFASRGLRTYEYYFSIAAPVFLMKLLGDDINCRISKSDLKMLQINTNLMFVSFIITPLLRYASKLLE